MRGQKALRTRHARHSRQSRSTTAIAVCCATVAALAAFLLALGRIGNVGPFAPDIETSYQAGAFASGAASSDALSKVDSLAVSAAETALGEARLAQNPEARLGSLAAYSPAAADLNALPGDGEPFAFCLNPSSPDASPQLSAESAQALEQALYAFSAQDQSAGFLLLDTGSGRGIAANIDARVYGASSFKGPFALYLCETMLDAGTAGRATLASESAAQPFITESLAGDSATAYPIGNLVENSIIYSDNDSFRTLRANFDGGLGTWLSGLGIDGAIANDTWFPHYSAREAALLWLHMSDYLQSGTENALWLDDLLASTEKSFIRDAVVGADGEAGVAIGGESGSDVRVRNKAGWIASADARYCGTCDAGLVEKDGLTWLVAVMTSAPDADTAEQNIEALISALWNARGDLA